MIDTVAQLAPLLVVGAFLPTWTTHIILLIAMTDRPVTNSLSFACGNFAYRMLLGVAVLFVISSEPVRRIVERTSALPESSRTFAGLVLLGAGTVLFMTRPREQREELPRWLRAVETVPPWFAFAWGFVNMAMPGFQYIYFLGGLGVIYKSGLSTTAQLGLLVCFSAALQTMLLAPIALYVGFRRRADRILGSLRIWLARWGNVLVGSILLFFGAVMVLQGLGLV